MLKLYHSPGACSLRGPSSALEESGLAYRGRAREPRRRRAAHAGLPGAQPQGPRPGARRMAISWSPKCPPSCAMCPDRIRRRRLWPTTPRDDARCAEWLAWISSGVHVAYAHIRRAGALRRQRRRQGGGDRQGDASPPRHLGAGGGSASPARRPRCAGRQLQRRRPLSVRCSGRGAAARCWATTCRPTSRNGRRMPAAIGRAPGCPPRLRAGRDRSALTATSFGQASLRRDFSR